MLQEEKGVKRPREDHPPLVVDLDGTLIHSDLLWETLVLFLRRHFLRAWLLPFWLFKGKAGFKEQLAREVELDVAALPYDKALLSLIRAERDDGRAIVLATGAQRRLADQVAAHTALFDLVLATESINLTSHNKAERLAALYGAQGYDYIGNSRADLPVWLGSRTAYCVAGKEYVLADGRSTTQVGSTRGGAARALFKALRPRQWLKNLLVFLPMLAAHALNADMLAMSLLAFAVFSACASSAYLLNDALDAQDDRLHPTKHKRPIAAGALPLPLALVASPLLALAALAVCAAIKPFLLLPLGVYFVATLAYSVYLKRLLMVDIVTLALLYCLRVLGGCAATGIAPSFWLLAFSFFIFLSLALLKRHSELFNLHRDGKEKTRGRGYTTADKTPVGIMGINAAFVSVLVFMLYFNSQNVVQMYRHPDWLFGIVPLLVFWLGRLWALSFRGQVNEDPVLYVSRDKVSLAVLALCAALVVAAAGW
ncbi:UbiA family prenyltransferase [Massilia solisilvae]|uniref:UbiA family prenyltransferase n=1 Tax=Massilia solisilvae TaxID=1811225 RepID=A0ABT2BDZ5_9BURK|nr:UbiA family prenyltransferase [Massilia solisilvae]MCS0606744.1 UbiA family prenyltransferase [Massilia solisilvae]